VLESKKLITYRHNVEEDAAHIVTVTFLRRRMLDWLVDIGPLRLRLMVLGIVVIMTEGIVRSNWCVKRRRCERQR
jgi:hypothetical protein